MAGDTGDEVHSSCVTRMNSHPGPFPSFNLFNLPLEIPSRCFLDQFDELNPAVPSDLMQLPWLWLHKQKQFQNSDFHMVPIPFPSSVLHLQPGIRMSIKTVSRSIRRVKSSGNIHFTIALLVVVPYAKPSPIFQFSKFCHQMFPPPYFHFNLQLETLLRWSVDLLDELNPAVVSILAQHRQLWHHSQKDPQSLRLKNSGRLYSSPSFNYHQNCMEGYFWTSLMC